MTPNTLEVTDIKGHDVGEAVALHGGDKTGVVSGLALNAMCGYKELPRVENAAFITKRRKDELELIEFGLNLLDSQSKSVVRQASSGNRPDFVNDLRYDSQLVITLQKIFGCCNRHRVVCMSWLRMTPKNVGIEENPH